MTRRVPHSALVAEVERLRAALGVIRLGDWRWKGGGSETRLMSEMSIFASKALGMPDELPQGWPSDDEYKQRESLRKRALSHALEGEGAGQ